MGVCDQPQLEVRYSTALILVRLNGILSVSHQHFKYNMHGACQSLLQALFFVCFGWHAVNVNNWFVKLELALR